MAWCAKFKFHQKMFKLFLLEKFFEYVFIRIECDSIALANWRDSFRFPLRKSFKIKIRQTLKISTNLRVFDARNDEINNNVRFWPIFCSFFIDFCALIDSNRTNKMFNLANNWIVRQSILIKQLFLLFILRLALSAQLDAVK